MSKITRCSRCGGNIVEPAYPGDGDYPVEPMCRCAQDRFKTYTTRPTRTKWIDEDSEA